jgi:hypothetical protein
MPREAYISTSQLATLDGWCRYQNLVSTVLLGRSLHGKMLFYSSLFQAGLDRVVIVKEESSASLPAALLEEVPSQRVAVFSLPDRASISHAISDYFESYLGSDWWRKPENERAISLSIFLADLLTSYRLRRPLLAPLSIPKLTELSVSLPLEIFVPIERLFRSIATYESVVAVPNMRVSHEQLSTIDEIFTSDEYGRVEMIHAELLGSASEESSLIELKKLSTALYWRYKDFLRLKSSIIRVIKGIPAFIDKLPGKDNLFVQVASSVAGPISTVISERMAKDDALVIYDATSILHELFKDLLHQFASSPIDEAAIESRMEQYPPTAFWDPDLYNE